MPAISASDSNIVPKSAKIMDVTTFDQPTRIRLTQGAGFAVSQRSKADYTHSSKDSYATQLSKLHTACYAVSFSSPSNSISWLDKSSLSLVASIPNAHVDTITSIRCPPYLSTHLGKDVLVSSGKDGLVKGWDTRTIGDQQCVFQCSYTFITPCSFDCSFAQVPVRITFCTFRFRLFACNIHSTFWDYNHV